MKRKRTLGRIIRGARVLRGIELQKLASDLERDPATVSRWERDLAPIPCGIIPDIARTLGDPDIAKHKILVDCPVWAYLQETKKKAA